MRERILIGKYSERKLRKWVFSLTFSAGITNAVAFLLYGQFIAHHTGRLTYLGIDWLDGNWNKWGEHLILIGAYLLGAMMAGIIFPEETFQLKRRYGSVNLMIGLGLSLFIWLNTADSIILIYLSLMAGLQNGMFVFYRGMVIRTTHVTGTITDLGLSLGRYFKGKQHYYLVKAKVMGGLLGSYLWGAILVGMIYSWTSLPLLHLIVLVHLFVAVTYYFVRHSLLNFKQIEKQEMI